MPIPFSRHTSGVRWTQRTPKASRLNGVVVMAVFLVAATSSAADFTVQTAEGTRHTGPLQKLTEEGTVKLGGDKSVEVAGADVLILRRAGVLLPALPNKPQLILVNGDRVPAEFLAFTDDRVRVRLAAEVSAEKEIGLSPTAVAAIWLADLETGAASDRLRRRLATQQRTHDTVLLRNGDVVEGVLVAANADTIEVEVNRQPLRVPRARAAAIAFSTELAADLKPKGPYVRVVLADGSRLSLTGSKSDGQTLTGSTRVNVPVAIPLDKVLSLSVHQGKAVYLSDLKPLREDRLDASPNLPWPTVNDGNALGNDLRLGGGVFDKGLGMHSENRVTFDVSGGYRRFQALVGLDDVAGQPGSVRVKVLVDGKPVNVGLDKELTIRDGPVAVQVPLTGAKELTLVVEFGRQSDVGDHVNWAEAMLVK